jgi:hypothetical protein
MLRPEQRNPAAPELLGSKSAGGADRLDRQADDDQDDTLPVSFVQSFSARWIATHFGMSLHHVALASRGSVYGGTVGASRQSPALVNGPGSLMTKVIAEAARCCALLVNEMVHARCGSLRVLTLPNPGRSL